SRPGPLVSYAVEDWDRMFAVNTRATWLLAKAAHDALAASRGAIVAVASMSGSNAHANLGPYGPTKAALIMLVQVLAQEFGRDGVRVKRALAGHGAHRHDREGVRRSRRRIRARRAGAARARRHARGHGGRDRIPARSRRALRQRPRSRRGRRRDRQLPRAPAGHLPDHQKLAVSGG